MYRNRIVNPNSFAERVRALITSSMIQQIEILFEKE